MPAPVLRSAHAVGVQAVERELDKLHAEMLRLGVDDGRTVRLSALTLVTIALAREEAELAERTVDALFHSHPARAIVILLRSEPEERVEADLHLSCATTPSGQVCGERVRLSVAGSAARHLSSLVIPLLVPDVPVFLWLVGAPPLPDTLTSDLRAMSDLVIADSGSYAEPAYALASLSRELADHPRLRIADLEWVRIRRWREFAAQAFDGPDLRPFVDGVTRVRVECAGGSVSAGGWLAAGWLEERLSSNRGRPAVQVAARAAPRVPAGELVGVQLWATRDGHRARVALRRRGSSLRTTIDVDGGITAGLAVRLTGGDAARLVGTILESSLADDVYPKALAHAARLATAGSAPATTTAG